MKCLFKRLAFSVGPVLACCICLSAHAASISINNGGFEAGLTGWTVVNEIGSDGTFFSQTGTASPVNGDTVPVPPQGVRAAMTDAEAGGSHVLYQDIVVPASLGTTLLTFDLFVGNR